MQTLSRKASLESSSSVRARTADMMKQPPLTFNIYIGDTTKQFWGSGASYSNQISSNNPSTSTSTNSFGRKALHHLHLTCCMKSRGIENELDSDEQNKRRKPSKKCDSAEEVKSYYAVTMDDYTEWCQSFDKLMESEAGREIFRLFCESEFSDENIKFWNTVQAFIKNNERNSEAEVRKCAQSIYDEYISVSAATQVSLTYSIQQKIQSNICQRTKKSISHTDEERQQLLKNDEKSENDDMLGNDAGIVPSATQPKRGSKKGSEQDYSENSDLRVTIRAGDGEHSKEHELNQIHAQTVFGEAIQHVYDVMRRDIYIRFKKSDLMTRFGKSLE